MTRDYTYISDFKKLGFGLFVHFGLYSIIGEGEWYLTLNPNADKEKYYSELIYKFNIDPNWAKELVSVAKLAGCKYITLTTRHHDGFSLFDTCGLNEFDSVHSSCKRDLIKEFVDACNEEGIVPFFYHTLLDWHEESYNNDFDKYIDYLIDSIKILCSNYGKIGGFWFDGFWDKPDANWQFDRLYETIRSLQPTAMIINNTGLSELGKVSHPEIDSVTFERGKPAFVDNSDRPRAGEMCETVNDHWGYTKDDVCYKTIPELINTLITCRACDCNLLLNTGLNEVGLVNTLDKEMFRYIGKWIKINKDIIYNIHPCDIKSSRGTIMTDDKSYYLFISDVPMQASLNVQRFSEIKNINILTDKAVINAKWLDNDEECYVSDNTVEVKPFVYGRSLSVRVLKFDLK